jgi:steroid 5-alpha reductase family enzyme
MNAGFALGLVWLLAATAMALGWQWQRARRNAGIVDVIWAAGVGGAAVVLAVLGDGAPLPRFLLAALGGLWGLRLAWFLARRVRGESEDGRYRALREHWRDSQWKFFAFFQFQALLVLLFALPFLAAARSGDGGWWPWNAVAVSVWLVAVAGEGLADRQLARFRADPANRGRTCRAGLWRCSRHPNYFFEWLHWFAYVALAAGSPWWWLALAGPVVMYAFLRWVSGVPWTEANALRSRGDDYREYQRTTPMFFPWFPKPAAPRTPR